MSVCAQSGLFAAILAAGRSARFGATKQLAPFDAKPLVCRSVRAAEQVCGRQTLLVTGHDWRRVHEACAPLEGFLLHNDEHASGMASSLAAALRMLPDSAAAILVLLADQPLVDAGDLANLAAAWRRAPERIVASRSDIGISPPVIFPRRFFPEIGNLRGDRGAREIIDRHRDAVIETELPHAAFDVDTREDLSSLDS